MKCKKFATMENVRSELEPEHKVQQFKSDLQNAKLSRLDILLKDTAEITMGYETIKSAISSSRESSKIFMSDIANIEATISRIENELSELKEDYGCLHDKYGETHEHYLKIVSQEKRMSLLNFEVLLRGETSFI